MVRSALVIFEGALKADLHPSEIVKPADGEPPHLNLKVWDTVSATQITAFTQKAQDGWFGLLSSS